MVDDHVRVMRGNWSWVAQGRGNRRAISKSKSRNRIATRKKRIENGSRAEPRGSKPHSYGESFSEFGFVWASQKFSIVRMMLSDKDRVSINKIMLIALLWGLARF